ncbi:uncharacterized protein LOC117648182 isoform X2 [Thrips palmi]|nr:uncharacterized protein LOC117648182 isoform X2 [Thrips palmi]
MLALHHALPADMGHVLTTTACNVHGLECFADPYNTHLVIPIIERLGHCGRLTSLKVTFVPFGNGWEAALGTLLQHVLQTEGLHLLHVLIVDEDASLQPVFPPIPPHISDAAVPASLRRLHYEYENSGVLDPFLQLLLTRHAATLESVGVWTVDPRAGVLLSAMPHLRKLECLLQEDMRALALPPSLRTLDLDLCVHLETAEPGRVPGLEAFLHAAVVQLDELVLRCGRGSWTDDPEVVELVRCVGGARATGSVLRSLAFQSGRGHATVILSPLASALAHLPRLARLDIGCLPTAAFLEALDGAVLPELTELTVCLTSLRACEHRWMHSVEVRGLMGRYPRLHVVIQSVQYKDGCQCKFCKMDCHDVPTKGPCLIYSHRRGSTSCEVNHKLTVGSEVCAEVCVNVI